MLAPSPISFEGPFAYVPHEGAAASRPRLRDVESLLLQEDALRTILVPVESPDPVRLDTLAMQLAMLACGALGDVRFTQLGCEDARAVQLADEHLTHDSLTHDSAVLGLVRLAAMRGESCTEIFAIDRGPWVDLPAVLGLLNTLLRQVHSPLRYAVLRGHTSAARVLCEDELAIRASVQAGLLELEDPDDALTRSYEDEPS